MYIKKSVLTVVICFAAAAVVIASGLVVKSELATKQVKQSAAYIYQQSFAELAEELDGLSADLMRGKYASSPYQAMTLAASVWKRAGAAKASLESLPTDGLNLRQIPTFLNQSGEYVLSLAKKLMNGGTLSDEDKQAVEALSEQAQNLAGQMTSLQYRVSSENLAHDALLEFIQLNDTPTDGDTETASMNGEKSEFTSENPLLNMENGLDFPELNYDGEYSSHLSKIKSVFLEDKEPIDDKEAKNRAAYILGCEPNDLEQSGDITLGDIKCFTFSGDDMDIAVTMRQGYPFSFTKNRSVGDAELSDDEAIRAGDKFLIKMRIAGMECVFHSVSGNILTGEYVFVQNGVYCYPDIIKLSIALDDGEILSMDARGYMTSHTLSRKLRASISEEYARTKVTGVNAGESRLCVIATNGVEENEKLCYEFSALAADGANIYVYINAHSGIEEKIDIVYETEEGKVRR